MLPRQKDPQRQAGVFAVEFAMVLILFLSIAYGVIEVARVMYMFNTLEEVTLRAAALAANTDFQDASAMSALRQAAVLRSTPGALPLGDPVTDASVRIDYLSLSNAGAVTMAAIPAAALPACAANNRITCMKNPYDASCIRLVRARICDPAVADSCQRVRYTTLLSLVSLPVNLPTATAIVPAETLGAPAGAAPCP